VILWHCVIISLQIGTAEKEIIPLFGTTDRGIARKFRIERLGGYGGVFEAAAEGPTDFRKSARFDCGGSRVNGSCSALADVDQEPRLQLIHEVA
jgi:hypothetical protein